MRACLHLVAFYVASWLLSLPCVHGKEEESEASVQDSAIIELVLIDLTTYNKAFDRRTLARFLDVVKRPSAPGQRSRHVLSRSERRDSFAARSLSHESQLRAASQLQLIKHFIDNLFAMFSVEEKQVNVTMVGPKSTAQRPAAFRRF